MMQTPERNTSPLPVSLPATATSFDAVAFGRLTCQWRRRARPRAVSRERKARAQKRYSPNGDARVEWPVDGGPRMIDRPKGRIWIFSREGGAALK